MVHIHSDGNIRHATRESFDFCNHGTDTNIDEFFGRGATVIDLELI
jgi:hypothetical protein